MGIQFSLPIPGEHARLTEEQERSLREPIGAVVVPKGKRLPGEALPKSLDWLEVSTSSDGTVRAFRSKYSVETAFLLATQQTIGSPRARAQALGLLKEAREQKLALAARAPELRTVFEQRLAVCGQIGTAGLQSAPKLTVARSATVAELTRAVSVPEHAYAVLDVRTTRGSDLLLGTTDVGSCVQLVAVSRFRGNVSERRRAAVAPLDRNGIDTYEADLQGMLMRVRGEDPGQMVDVYLIGGVDLDQVLCGVDMRASKTLVLSLERYIEATPFLNLAASRLFDPEVRQVVARVTCEAVEFLSIDPAHMVILKTAEKRRLAVCAMPARPIDYTPLLDLSAR